MSQRSESGVPETRYEVFEVGASTITMVSEVGNRQAWLQSSLTVAIEP